MARIFPERPLPWYGPEDQGPDFDLDIELETLLRRRDIAYWELAYAMLPFWQRVFYWLNWRFEPPFEVVLTGPDDDKGIFTPEGVRLY